MKRKCAECGAILTDEHVMKIKIEDDTIETIPFSVCPDCFGKQMLEQAHKRRDARKSPSKNL